MMYILNFRTITVTVGERIGERYGAAYLPNLRGGRDPKLLSSKKLKKEKVLFWAVPLPQTHDDPIGDWSSLREDQSPC